MWSRNRPSASAMAVEVEVRAAAAVRDGGEQAVDGGEAEAGVGDHGSGRDLAGRERRRGCRGAAGRGGEGRRRRAGRSRGTRRASPAAIAFDASIGSVESFTCETTGPAVLAEAGLVEAGDVVAVEQRGGREDLVDGDDTRPADAGQVEVVEPVDGDADRAPGGLRVDAALAAGRGRGRLARAAPDRRRAARLGDGHEGRAVAVEAGVVVVARRLVDAGLAAELGVDGLHREAVALDAAVAAALADVLVDEDAQRRASRSCRACGRAASRWRTAGRRSSR